MQVASVHPEAPRRLGPVLPRALERRFDQGPLKLDYGFAQRHGLASLHLIRPRLDACPAIDIAIDIEPKVPRADDHGIAHAAARSRAQHGAS